LAHGGEIRYDTIREAILTCAQKLTYVSLILTEPTTKKVEEKNEEVKTDMLRGIGKQSGGIREVSPEEEKEDYDGMRC